MMTMDEIIGFERDWIAVDAIGCVGFFSTAGGGYVSEHVLSYLDRCEAAIDSALMLPESTQPSIAPQVAPALRNIWAELAARGWFSFDSDYHGGPYRRVAVPITPIHVTDLPGSVREIVENLAFDVPFRELNCIDKLEIDRARPRV